MIVNLPGGGNAASRSTAYSAVCIEATKSGQPSTLKRESEAKVNVRGSRMGADMTLARVRSMRDSGGATMGAEDGTNKT